MATQLQIEELRINTRTVGDPTYTDEFLGGLIDAYGLTESELKVWTAKRNTVAALVDISEGGSSRKMSQLFDQYSKIVAGYGEDTSSSAGRAPRTREITRS